MDNEELRNNAKKMVKEIEKLNISIVDANILASMIKDEVHQRTESIKSGVKFSTLENENQNASKESNA